MRGCLASFPRGHSIARLTHRLLSPVKLPKISGSFALWVVLFYLHDQVSAIRNMMVYKIGTLLYYLCIMNEETDRSTTLLNGWYTTGEAADRLGVSIHQVARLIKAGDLDAIKSVGGAYVIEAVSLHTYMRLRGGRGRPYSAEVAWAALWLLSDLEVDWLTYQQSRRLREKLNEVGAEELVWAVRRRAQLQRMRIDASFFNIALQSLLVSGASSPHLSRIGLTQSTSSIEGYLYEKDLTEFMRNTHAVAATDVNAMIRILDKSVPIDLTDRSEMPLATVAVDLASSLHERDQKAGIETLELLLEKYRA